ncbi:MAG TPA: DUF4382 domain-containing protein [Terracidiphilus sp.]|nr:DUF4382 domain-containing protein [Terracidiphilus sp.]
MSPKSHQKLLRLALLLLSGGALAATGCTNGLVTNGSTSGAETGPAFVVGTDAPVASVTSFSVQIMSIDAINSSGTSVPLMSGTPTVDFARYNGLQTLLDMNDVPAGTYNSVTISLGTGTIGYLDTSAGGAPTIQTEAATFTTTSVNVTLDKPLVVVQGGSPAGLRVDFDLHKSIQVDSNGNITGTVDPTFNINAVANNDGGGYIDTFVAGVLSVDTTSQSFVVTGPHGENFTIDVNGQTEWDGDASLSALNTSCIVEVSGTIDHADQTLDADEVAILSNTGFYAAGQVTYVTPASGAATSFDLYVRGLLPTDTGLTLGQIAQVNLTGNEKFFIYWMHNPFTEFLFNSSSMVAGQHVAVGGPASGASNPDAVTVERIHLRNWGFNGTIVAGSQNSSNSTFQMQVNGFAGVLIPETITVYLGDHTDFRYGLGSWSDLTDGANIRVVGLLLKNPTNGQVVLLARHIDGTEMTDFTTAAFD